ncbi:hypothetical protein OF83DRAFT_1068546 [Amylostereum chailletii]|nr:hypothetical protein OF83DRAFT_1068546 [Amylostereum chailletii]
MFPIHSNPIISSDPSYLTGFRDFYPPVRTCLDPQCATLTHDRRELVQQLPIEVVVFTWALGPVPAWSHSAKCRNCSTHYYPGYCIHGDTRIHYSGVPPAIQVTTHAYVEKSLCAHWRDSKAHAWVSATNNARIYKLEHASKIHLFPKHWTTNPELSPEIIWDTFFQFSLLCECDEQVKNGSPVNLVMNNSGDQATRLHKKLDKRNKLMVGPGQEYWDHVCDLCCKVKVIDGKPPVVTDGITIGRPCCSVHDCQGDLPSQQARFCLAHSAKIEECAVDGCTASVEQGYRTCPEEQHRKLEALGDEGHTAMFQLRRRAQRHGVLQPEESILSSSGTDEVLQDNGLDVDEDGICPEKDEAGNTKLRARFSRRRTHGEQLCVATCGVILGRATMYGSEAVSAVRVSSIELTDHEPHLANCALPVDVFHMKTKHKDSDKYCGTHCNPVLFPDLIQDGKWRFNSSAAEMTNSWFGGFQSIVQEMRKDRYDFFLDEMIKQRNRMIVNDLECRGLHPYHIHSNI